MGAEGGLRRTDKGELSVVVRSLQVLTKSLLPLPDKWNGLADVEARYRKRYLDMIVTPGVIDTFKARSKIVSTLRNYLENQEFPNPTVYENRRNFVVKKIVLLLRKI